MKNKPMTKTEWMNWLEKAWDEAQQREWVALTDEEVYQAESGCWFMDEFDKTLFARAIEAKLKEKNQ